MCVRDVSIVSILAEDDSDSIISWEVRAFMRQVRCLLEVEEDDESIMVKVAICVHLENEQFMSSWEMYI